jgi:ribosomal protein S15P/S13E
MVTHTGYYDPAAGVELAKYLEHHRKDYQAALQLVEGVLSRRDLPASLRRALQERQGRLLKRVSADCP